MLQTFIEWREWQLGRPLIGSTIKSVCSSLLVFLSIGPVHCSLLLSTGVSVKFISLFAVEASCISRPQICKLIISYESALVESSAMLVSLESILIIVCSVIMLIRSCGVIMSVALFVISGSWIISGMLVYGIERSFFIGRRDSLLSICHGVMNKVSLGILVLSICFVCAIFGLSFLITVRLVIWLTISSSLIAGITTSWLMLWWPSKLPKIFVSLGIIVTLPFISLHVGRLRLTRWLWLCTSVFCSECDCALSAIGLARLCVRKELLVFWFLLARD